MTNNIDIETLAVKFGIDYTEEFGKVLKQFAEAYHKAKIEQVVNAEHETPIAYIENLERELAELKAEKQRQQEPVAWYTEDFKTDKSATTWDKKIAERWKDKGWPVYELFTTPPDQSREIEELKKDKERLDWLQINFDNALTRENIDKVMKT